MFGFEGGRSTTGRRGFLASLAGIPAAAISAGRALGAGDPAESGSAPMPSISLGKHRISRLVAGWNPIGGYSYLGHHMDRHMKEYFTPERTVEFLLACEREGVDAHQFSLAEKTPEVLRAVRERGSKMRFICLHAGRAGIGDAIANTRPIAMAHHGGVTDRLFAEGKGQEVHDYVKEAHDRGVLAGVSAHNPAVIERIADEGWEVDFFMTCFYFLTRKGPPPGAEKEANTLQIAYPFYVGDPHAMTEVIRKIEKPCLAFKILGAGRKCASEAAVRDAFRYAFERIKPADGVIVGMYPRFFDEIGANARYAREFGHR
ncbi:MAG: hypothetical protein JXP34_00305 [Planctomycetes bacterium]|nr:hypothetical protein [Planctomycetota bacterium]